MGRRAVVVTVVGVVVLVGGAVVADGIARDRAEQRIATTLQTELGLAQPPDVTIDGSPFLTQLVAGELSDVHLTSPAATVGGLDLADITVDLSGVSTSAPTTAHDARVDALMTVDAAQALLPADLALDLAIDGSDLVASTTLLGLPLDAALTPRADGRAIVVDVRQITVAGLAVTVDDLPSALAAQVTGLRIPLDGLPDGTGLTSVTVTDAGLRLTAAGQDVVLDASAPSD
ncbi:MAG: DUF2993 domain-containing protein [Cellulomonadaceae bacterium]|nr:DUF2993 domain-containing protein [Cellulomonadaceae bacterium]